MNLAIRTLKSAIVGLLVLAVIIFVPAGTLAYWQGWAFLVVFTLSTNLIGVYLALRDPALLERRIKAGPGAENRPVQKGLITLAFAGAIALVIVSVFDYRFGWSYVPAWVSVFGNLLVALGLMIDLVVFRENSYGSSTIEKMEGQTVISTGPYALVRHPMYVGVLILVVGVPLALGSYWGLLFMLLNVPILVLRILDEEKMLRSELGGYTDYTRRVRYRLVPGLW
ncbi:isoprenylcysteine carboxylmethyltransferase family protein [Mesorhizobium sp. YC-39]|uniref:methyltransferase family protein n=1 Tax=unclassified Mesorhizobium TaxID=325217 RepID=UPI0021E78D48|nr:MULTISPECIES: isoprenylcysteine carboxylmethyltransferase family protein [unclassified Mesorhizobium]MCV3205801.1 isoprenylcysteine carboxylmethyltransferase family protein [Mesorhizobium sp. YC-2]MCV3227800.1 isoprenylcysteine carboxylmethyltransferase family protein [Mesorhizobium sp. YC-39]